MIETPRLEDREALQSAVVHVTVPRAEIQAVMGPAIHEVLDVVHAQGIGPAGPLFDHHPAMHPDTFDFDVGFPVSTPVAPTGRVRPGTLPAARVVRTVYHGGYEGLGDAWGEFDAWIAEHGIATAEEIWESFLVGPESSDDPADWRTELVRPLA